MLMAPLFFDDALDEEDVQKITGYQVPVVVVNNKIENQGKSGIYYLWL